MTRGPRDNNRVVLPRFEYITYWGQRGSYWHVRFGQNGLIDSPHWYGRSIHFDQIVMAVVMTIPMTAVSDDSVRY